MSGPRKWAHALFGRDLSSEDVDKIEDGGKIIETMNKNLVPMIPFPQDFLNIYFKEANRLGVRNDIHRPPEAYPRCLNPQCYNPPGHAGRCDDIPF